MRALSTSLRMALLAVGNRETSISASTDTGLLFAQRNPCLVGWTGL